MMSLNALTDALEESRGKLTELPRGKGTAAKEPLPPRILAKPDEHGHYAPSPREAARDRIPEIAQKRGDDEESVRLTLKFADEIAYEENGWA